MKNKIYVSLLSMLLMLPMALNSAAEPIGKMVNFITTDGQAFKVLEDVAKSSLTIKNWIEDLSGQDKYEFSADSGITGEKFENVLRLMKFAYSMPPKSSEARTQTISSYITGTFINRSIPNDSRQRLQELMEDVNQLDIEILKIPLADCLIKFIHSWCDGNRYIIEDKISSLPIPDEFKALLAKFWYLNFGKGRNFILPKLDYCFSVEELAVHNKLPAIDHHHLSLECLRISDLTGLAAIPNIASVRQLVLDYNRITLLPENIFDGFINVFYIGLTNNKLTTVSENTFKRLVKLKELYLIDNPILPEIQKSLKSLLGIRVIFAGYAVQC